MVKRTASSLLVSNLEIRKFYYSVTYSTTQCDDVDDLHVLMYFFIQTVKKNGDGRVSNVQVTRTPVR